MECFQIFQKYQCILLRINTGIYNGKQKWLPSWANYLDYYSKGIEWQQLRGTWSYTTKNINWWNWNLKNRCLQYLQKNMKIKSFQGSGSSPKSILYKKGNPANVENYRPNFNLCSAHKIFEKLILFRLQNLEKWNKIENIKNQERKKQKLFVMKICKFVHLRHMSI